MTTKTGRELMAYLAEGAYQDVRAQYDAEALAAAFTTVYGGPKSRVFLEELEHCEITLDDLWPGWREKEPFAHLAPDDIAAIKVPLARRRQLLLGAGEWGLRLVWRGNMPLAVAIRPKREHVKPPPDVYYEPNYSAPHLAASTGLPLATVEAALACFSRDCGINARAWCIEYASQQEGA